MKTEKLTNEIIQEFLNIWHYIHPRIIKSAIKALPKEYLEIEPEEYWDSPVVPRPAMVLGSGKFMFRVMNTNIWLLKDGEDVYAKCEWLHLKNYRDYIKEVLNRTSPCHPSATEIDSCIKQHHRDIWTLPEIVAIYDYNEKLSLHPRYTLQQRKILADYKYYYAHERPVDRVYALACFLHTGVQYYQNGACCSADIYEEDEENGEIFDDQYNGLPDDFSVLMAHAVLVMGDRKRYEALQKLRSIFRNNTGSYHKNYIYEEALQKMRSVFRNDREVYDRTYTFEEALQSNARFSDYYVESTNLPYDATRCECNVRDFR